MVVDIFRALNNAQKAHGSEVAAILKDIDDHVLESVLRALWMSVWLLPESSKIAARDGAVRMSIPGHAGCHVD